jgi:hypothetical protein
MTSTRLRRKAAIAQRVGKAVRLVGQLAVVIR